MMQNPLLDAARPVKGRGKMTQNGYVPENAAYLDALTKMVDGRRVGRDPMTIPVDVLKAAGHGRRSVSAVWAAMGDVPLVKGARGRKGLRRQCLDMCAENAADARQCPVIDCPIWPYRMGRDPYDARRGVVPAGISRLRSENPRR